MEIYKRSIMQRKKKVKKMRTVTVQRRVRNQPGVRAGDRRLYIFMKIERTREEAETLDTSSAILVYFAHPSKEAPAKP
jgi:hypothetical protein